MKMLIAIVNNDDAHFVNTSLTGAGFSVTKISSTGGFLMSGNSTFLMGIEEEQIDKALEIIKTHSRRRVQDVPLTLQGSAPSGVGIQSATASINVGGATVFILDVEKCLRF